MNALLKRSNGSHLVTVPTVSGSTRSTTPFVPTQGSTGLRPTPKPTTIRPPPAVEAVVGPCQEGQYSQSGPDCSVYQWCVNGQLIDQGCQKGLHWNQQIKVCDWPANAKCPFSGSMFLFYIQ